MLTRLCRLVIAVSSISLASVTLSAQPRGFAIGEPIPGFKLLTPVSLLDDKIYYGNNAFVRLTPLIKKLPEWTILNITPSTEGPAGDFYYLIMQAKGSRVQLALRTQRRLAISLAIGDTVSAKIYTEEPPIIYFERMNRDVIATLMDISSVTRPAAE